MGDRWLNNHGNANAAGHKRKSIVINYYLNLIAIIRLETEMKEVLN